MDGWPRRTRSHALALVDRMAAERRRLRRRFPALFGARAGAAAPATGVPA